MDGAAGVAGGQGIGFTSVPQGKTRWCQPQALSAPLFIWFQLSLPAQLLSQAAPEETSTSSPCLWVPNNRSGQVAFLEIPFRALWGQNSC